MYIICISLYMYKYVYNMYMYIYNFQNSIFCISFFLYRQCKLQIINGKI